jgi:hypothetical protein
VPQARARVGLPVPTNKHHARRLVRTAGLREEGRGLREFPPELRRTSLREDSRRAELSSEDTHEMIS